VPEAVIIVILFPHILFLNFMKEAGRQIEIEDLHKDTEIPCRGRQYQIGNKPETCEAIVEHIQEWHEL
jgi:hypothetical protein